MEKERPCCYNEFVGANDCWDALGMRIKWTKPPVPSVTKKNMYDPIVLRLCLECKKPVPIRDVSAWAWTCIFHADNQEGIYREIKLKYHEELRTWNDDGVTLYEFSAIIFPTNDGRYRLTFNVKFRDNMIWVDKKRKDAILRITQSRANNMWVKSARQSQITRNIFIGNFLSVMVADEMGFHKVLSLDEITKDQLGANLKVDMLSIIRLFIETEPGAGKVIPDEKIVRIVNWLKEAGRADGNVLVGDYTGQGRAGSAVTAYIYANNPNLTFEEAHGFVRKRRFVFCHKGLKDTLVRLYPRD